MEPSNPVAEKIYDHASDLLDTYFKLTTIKATEKVTNLASSAILNASIFLVTLFILFFLGIGIAWWIGEQMENIKAGFFIVGGVYAFLLVIILALRKYLFPHLRDR